jgi:hypothetical protein
MSRVSTEGGVLSRIRNIEASGENRMKVSLFGMPKTGKTRLACTFPKPLLIIGSEDGTASVVGTKGVQFIRLRECAEISELIDGPIKEGVYKTVVLDNGTKLRDMRIAEILGLSETPVQKGWGFARREQWGECANSLKQLLRPLVDLPDTMDLNVVIIAHEGSISGSDEDSNGASDVIRPAVSSMLGKSLCLWVNGWADYMGQTFIREVEETVNASVGGQTKSMTRRTGKKEYCLRIGAHDIYTTSFRLPPSLANPPEVIVNPTYEKIKTLIQGKPLGG